MAISLFEIRVKGKATQVPSICIDDKRVIALGKWLKIASVHDEDWLEGEAVEEPELFLGEIKREALKADVFTFAQKIPETKPRYDYPMEWDNAAVIPITTFPEWWEKRLPQVTRKNVRRSAKRGVSVRTVSFDDELVRGICRIYSETPIKQGIPFAHHGKDFETVKKEVSTILERSEFIGAYFEDDLIGFIKLIYLGRVASILHIVSMDQHYDRKPANALITKAMEICAQKKMSHLVYGKYTYGNKTNSALTEFKHRTGFEPMLFPRYYVPLTVKGEMAVLLGLHRGLIGILPTGVIALLLKLRVRFYKTVSVLSGTGSASKARKGAEAEGESGGVSA
jgi:hypothetical protein